MGIFDAFTKNGRSRSTLTARSQQAFNCVQAARAALDSLDLTEATRQEAAGLDHVEVILSMVLTLEGVPGRAIDAGKAIQLLKAHDKYAEDWEAVRLFIQVRARVAALSTIKRDCARLVNLVEVDATRHDWDNVGAPRPALFAVRDLFVSVVNAFLTLEDLDPGTQPAARYALEEMQNRPKYREECATMERTTLFLLRHGWEDILATDESGEFIHR